MLNTFKLIALFTLLSIILISFGGLIGGQSGIWFAFIFSLLLNVGMYFFSDRIALSSANAKKITQKQNPDLYNEVEVLAKKMNMKMPALYISDMPQANAFATGRNQSHASVAVTTGLLNILSRDELRGVLAHELAHIKNRDILIATIAAVFASAISFLGNMALWSGISNNDEDNNSGMLGIFAAILLPLAATLIQLAISRDREFSADNTGAKLIGNGQPLANALIEINASVRRNPARINPSFSSLYINNPLDGIGGKITHLFSTHPPVEERVKRLQKI